MLYESLGKSGLDREYDKWMKMLETQDPAYTAIQFANRLKQIQKPSNHVLKAIKNLSEMAKNPEDTTLWLKGVTGAKNFKDAVSFIITNMMLSAAGLGVYRGGGGGRFRESIETISTMISEDTNPIVITDFQKLMIAKAKSYGQRAYVTENTDKSFLQLYLTEGEDLESGRPTSDMRMDRPAKLDFYGKLNLVDRLQDPANRDAIAKVLQDNPEVSAELESMIEDALMHSSDIDYYRMSQDTYDRLGGEAKRLASGFVKGLGTEQPLGEARGYNSGPMDSGTTMWTREVGLEDMDGQTVVFDITEGEIDLRSPLQKLSELMMNSDISMGEIVLELSVSESHDPGQKYGDSPYPEYSTSEHDLIRAYITELDDDNQIEIPDDIAREIMSYYESEISDIDVEYDEDYNEDYDY